MSELREWRPPLPTPRTGALSEDEELNQYIHSFTVSSDRVRHIVVVAVVASVMAFAAQWNSIAEISWWLPRLDELRVAVRNELWREPDARLEMCRNQGQKAAEFIDSCERVAHTMDSWLRSSSHGKVSLEARLAELEKTWVNEVLMVDVPFLGIRFDVNDLGAFSAIGLAIIMMMLAFAMARQHENLYLSLWKIRRLAEKESRYDDGESKANFLYHALAMAQVFTRPPTLARDHPRPWAKLAILVLLLTPLAVQGLILAIAVRTLRVGQTLSARSTYLTMSVQVVFMVLILMSTVACLMHSSATYKRWWDTFFEINPALRSVTGSPWWEWVRFAHSPHWHFTADETGTFYFGEPIEFAGRRASQWMAWKIIGLTTGKINFEPISDPAALPAPPPVLASPGGTFCIDGPLVRRVEAGGKVVPLAQGGDPFGGFHRSQRPKLLGLAIEGDRLLIADYDYACIRGIGLDGKDLKIRYRSPWYWSPAGIAVRDGSVYVVEHRRLSLIGGILGKLGPIARIVRLSRDPARESDAEPLLWRSPFSRAVLARDWLEALR